MPTTRKQIEGYLKQIQSSDRRSEPIAMLSKKDSKKMLALISAISGIDKATKSRKAREKRDYHK